MCIKYEEAYTYIIYAYKSALFLLEHVSFVLFKYIVTYICVYSCIQALSLSSFINKHSHETQFYCWFMASNFIAISATNFSFPFLFLCLLLFVYTCGCFISFWPIKYNHFMLITYCDVIILVWKWQGIINKTRGKLK